MVAALAVFLMLACVAVQGYVGLQTTQVVNVDVSDGEQGWGALVRFSTGTIQWTGPFYVRTGVWWSPAYKEWYAVYAYNASQANYVNWIYVYRDH